MKWPKISIVTPSYNQGRYIEETIRSVVNQDYPNIEYFVIDGGSRDHTVDIIKKYEGRITYWVSEPDKGQTDAIIKGFKRTTGEIAGWLNSDDQYYSSNVFREVAKFFLENPDIGGCYGDNVYIDENNNLLYMRKGIPLFSKRLLYAWNFIHQPAVFMRKRIIDELELNISLHYVMDYEYWLRIAEVTRLKYINLIISASRWHSECKTMASRDDVFSELKKVYHTLKRGHIVPFILLKYINRLFYNLNRVYSLPFLLLINRKQRDMDMKIKSWRKLLMRQLLGLSLAGFD